MPENQYNTEIVLEVVAKGDEDVAALTSRVVELENRLKELGGKEAPNTSAEIRRFTLASKESAEGFREFGRALQATAMSQFRNDLAATAKEADMAEQGFRELAQAVKMQAMEQVRQEKAQRDAATASEKMSASIRGQAKSLVMGTVGLTAMVQGVKALYQNALDLENGFGPLTSATNEFRDAVQGAENSMSEGLAPAFTDVAKVATGAINMYENFWRRIGALSAGASWEESKKIAQEMEDEQKEVIARQKEMELAAKAGEAAQRAYNEQVERETEAWEKQQETLKGVNEEKKRLAELNRKILDDIGDEMNPSSREFVPGAQVGATSEQWRAFMSGAPIQGQEGSFVSLPDQSGFTGLSQEDEDAMNALEDSAERQAQTIIDGFQTAQSIMEAMASGDAVKITTTIAGGVLQAVQAAGMMLGPEGAIAGAAIGLVGGLLSGNDRPEYKVIVQNPDEIASELGRVIGMGAGASQAGAVLALEAIAMRPMAMAINDAPDAFGIRQRLEGEAEDIARERALSSVGEFTAQVHMLSDAFGVGEAEASQMALGLQYQAEAQALANMSLEDFLALSDEEKQYLLESSESFQATIHSFADGIIRAQEDIDSAREGLEDFSHGIAQIQAELSGNEVTFFANDLDSLATEFDNAQTAAESLAVAEKQVAAATAWHSAALAKAEENLRSAGQAEIDDLEMQKANLQALADEWGETMDKLQGSFDELQAAFQDGVAGSIEEINRLEESRVAKAFEIEQQRFRFGAQFEEKNAAELVPAILDEFRMRGGADLGSLVAGGDTRQLGILQGLLSEAQGNVMLARGQSLIGTPEADARLAELAGLFDQVFQAQEEIARQQIMGSRFAEMVGLGGIVAEEEATLGRGLTAAETGALAQDVMAARTAEFQTKMEDYGARQTEAQEGIVSIDDSIQDIQERVEEQVTKSREVLDNMYSAILAQLDQRTDAKVNEQIATQVAAMHVMMNILLEQRGINKVFFDGVIKNLQEEAPSAFQGNGSRTSP